MPTRTGAVLGRLWATALTLAVLWAVLLIVRNPGWPRECLANPESLLLVAPLVFGPLVIVVWARWLFRGK